MLNDVETQAVAYATKHSGLNDPKDNRFGRYYRAFLAGAEWQREFDAKLCEGAWGGAGPNTKASCDTANFCARRIREQIRYKQQPGGEFRETKEQS